jgi:hypothetical protein
MNRRTFASGSVSLLLMTKSMVPQIANSSPDKLASESGFSKLLEQFHTDPSLARSVRAEQQRGFEAAVAHPQNAPRGRISTRKISERANELIIYSEVTNENNYTTHYESPTWPGLHSGLTIGIGYDLGWVNEGVLRQDWKTFIPAAQLDRLVKVCGIRGVAASDLVDKFADIKVPWSAAIEQYSRLILPMTIGATEDALENTQALSADSFGALVSLVYNRGTTFREEGVRYSQMRAIREHMKKKQFQMIPAEIRTMKHLWPNAKGVILRREAEASLFENGLKI